MDKPEQIVSFNGKIVKASECPLLITEKSVWYDFGVYESIKVLQGKVCFGDLHVSRIFNSAKLIGLNIGFSERDVLGWIDDLVRDQKLDNHLLRMAVYGDADNNEKANVYIFALGLTFYPNKFYSQGVKAKTHQGQRQMPQAKSFDLLINFMALREATKQGALEALLINRSGFVTEGTRSNLFIIEDNKIITPPKSEVLEGVTRIHIQKIALINNIPLLEENITLDRLLKADEIFITSTSMNIMPVSSINDKTIGQGIAGPLTKQLTKLFSDYQKNYLSQK